MSHADAHALKPEQMHFRRHWDIQTGRPYDLDVDDAGQLWQGSGSSLFRYDTRTGEAESYNLPILQGRSACAVFAFGGKVVLLNAQCRVYSVFDPATQRATAHPLPGDDPIVWYGLKAAGKLLMFDRHVTGGVLILDEPGGNIRKVVSPWDDFQMPGAGTLLPDGRVMFASDDPLRLTFFDPEMERFTDRVDTGVADVALSGKLIYNNVLYASDSAGGQFAAIQLDTGKFDGFIKAPEHGKTYGFIGGNFVWDSRSYHCLSTYKSRSTLDRKTGKLVVPPDAHLGVDGHPHHFMDRMLVFNAADQTFDFFTPPVQPDGIPLLCYSWADRDRAYATGYVIPYGANDEPTPHPGDWLIWQNHPTAVQPFDGARPRNDNAASRRRFWFKRTPVSRGLFQPADRYTPAVDNLVGPAFEYPISYEADLKRRLEATDRKQYYHDLATQIDDPGADPKDRVARVGHYIQSQLYYNPIWESHVDPIVANELGDSRCGQAMNVAMNILDAMGMTNRNAPLQNHTIAEVEYDGSWHMLDPLILGGRQMERDGRVLSVAEVQADPTIVDHLPIDCFAYESEELRANDGFYVLGYVFGEWGSMPYYSFYFGGPRDYPPTMPLVLPAQRVNDQTVRLRWAPAIKRGGGDVQYRLRICEDRALRQEVASHTLDNAWLDFTPPKHNVMYHYAVQAIDPAKPANTWYPTRVGNFVLVPDDQYGWYGVV